ncbi:MAG: Holliday junction branch migration protein RuvA [Tannerella sp.]|jgi:Holliday junction DNA helicase RuvA|nr:Holliday junction branch migration protein RuvA [Tannerella sp.]
MIEYIKGEIVACSPARLIVECNGTGYEIHISLTTYSVLQNESNCKIFIYEVIREDAHLLFGFATKEERELFLLLTSVSGVGPNTARMILSSMPPAELVYIIAGGDEKMLTQVKGIGSKTAQRIIVDLKNKVKLADKKTNMPSATVHNKAADEAVAALVMLGFPKAASQKVTDSILKKTPDTTVEQLIKTALKML